MDRLYVIGWDEVPQHIMLGAGESLKATFVFPSRVDAALDLTVDLTGPGAELDLAGIFVCADAETVDIRTRVRHLAGGCKSNQLFRGVADGRSRVRFDGLVYVAPDAQKTEAYQSCNSLLLNEGARVETDPQLEIYADDVVCSHGAAIGYLSADELFYMRSRGIPEEEARRLQILSFLSPVLSRLPESAYSLIGFQR